MNIATATPDDSQPVSPTLAYAQSIAANIADLAKLEKELAQLRADNKVLAEEVRAWRKVNGSAQYVRTLARLRADRQSIEEAMKISQSFMDDSLPIIKATDASGALARANKESA